MRYIGILYHTIYYIIGLANVHAYTYTGIFVTWGLHRGSWWYRRSTEAAFRDKNPIFQCLAVALTIRKRSPDSCELYYEQSQSSFPGFVCLASKKTIKSIGATRKLRPRRRAGIFARRWFTHYFLFALARRTKLGTRGTTRSLCVNGKILYAFYNRT